MSSFFDSLQDGWSIYLWLIAGGIIILAVIYWMNWARKNEQFDEDIKYVMFEESDIDKMDPEEYKKSREVIARQIARRDEILLQQAAKKAAEREAK